MKIEFYSVIDGIDLAYPPIPISDVKMSWVEKSQEALRNRIKQNSTDKTATHLCSGIRELTQLGYAITAWHDIELTTIGDGSQYHWYVPGTNYGNYDENIKPVESFPAEIYGNHAVLPPQTLKTIIKIPTPWRVNMPKGWGLLTLPMHYADEDRFTQLIGILDPTRNPALHAVLYWHRLHEKVTIKAGTPLFYVVPVKIDDRLEVEIRSATDKEMRWEKIRTTITNSVFVNGSTKYKQIFDKFWNKL